jgi:hypothetical protein
MKETSSMESENILSENFYSDIGGPARRTDYGPLGVVKSQEITPSLDFLHEPKHIFTNETTQYLEEQKWEDKLKE